MKRPSPAPSNPGQDIDSSALQGLAGYATRRAWLVLQEHFKQHMSAVDLRPVPFTLLTLIGANPGITSTQLCTMLDMPSSNLVGLVKQLQDRDLIERQPHPGDGRALGLHLRAAGRSLLRKAREAAERADRQATAALSDAELAQLLALLGKIHGR